MELHQEVERLRAEVNCLGVALTDKTQEGLVLADKKRKLSKEIEVLKRELTHKEKDFFKATNSFKENVAQSYLVGFEAALEQATVVHPAIDFSELDLDKTVVEGKLVGGT